MKKGKTKRAAIAVILALTMLCSSCPAAFAAVPQYKAVSLPDGGLYNVYEYCDEVDFDVWYLDENGSRSAVETEDTCAVSIRGVRSDLLNTAGYLSIPDSYRGYPVTRLEKPAKLSRYLGVRIPASVEEIADPTFINCPYLEWIEVDIQNPYYYSVDGVLYRGNVNFGTSRLVCYPQAKTDEAFTTFAGAQVIREKAFFDNPYLQTLTIAVGPQGMSVYPDAISDCESLEALILGDGVGFSDICTGAVKNCPNLSTVHLPSSYVGYLGGSRLSLHFFDLQSGARTVTVCSPYVTTELAEAAAETGNSCRDCGLQHYVPVVDEPQFPNQPLPEPISDINEGLFLFSTLYQKDADGKYVKDENGDYIAIGESLIGLSRVISVPINLTIPSSHGGLPVLMIQSTFGTYFENLFSLHIPSTVQTIEKGALCCATLKEITVDTDSTYFKSEDGVLYSADGKTLVAYPNAKEITDFVIPEGTEAFADDDVFFDWNCPLQTISLPSTFNDPNAAENGIALINLKKYIVSADNPTLYADDAGVLYNKNQTILLRYPACGAAQYTLPSCVVAIDNYALTNMNGRKVICVPDGSDHTPMANLIYADVIGHENKICLHIPRSVSSIQYSNMRKTETIICCETSASQAAAFAQKNDLSFRICNDNHTVLREITENDPPVPEFASGDLFDSYYIWKTGANGTYIEGVGIYGLKEVPSEPFTLTIPETYNGLLVLEIDEASYLYSGDMKPYLTRVEIPSTVRKITDNSFSGCSVLREFVVDKANQNYCAEDGVLYNKDKSVLLKYPAAKQDKAFSIPDTVQSVGISDAFAGNTYLRDLTIPASFTQAITTAFRAFRTLQNLRSYTVEYGNPVYSSDMYGVLFNAEKTVLLHIPPNVETEFYTIPVCVQKLYNSYSIRTLTNLRVLCIDSAANATPSGVLVPPAASSLKYLHIPASVSDVRFTLVRTLTICSDTTEGAAAAFAKEKNCAFMLCNADHTQFTPVEQDEDDELFEFEYIETTDENGITYNAGVTITGLREPPAGSFELTIPAQYHDLPVLRFDVSGWPEDVCGRLTALRLPETLEVFEGIASKTATYFTNLKTITVDEANSSFYAKDGVLYHKIGQCLVLYPAGKQDASYAVPDGIKYFFSSISFSDNNYLRKLSLPASFDGGVLSQTLQALRHIPSLEYITVAEDNPVYSADTNGVLYDAEKTTLILYPRCAAADVFTIPASVESLYSSDSIHSPKYLRVLCVADGKTQTPAGTISVFTYADSALRYIHIPSSVTDIQFSAISLSLTICSDAADCAASAFARQNGNAFLLCSDDHSVFLSPDNPPQPSGMLSLTVSGGTAKPGDTVQVTVNAAENPGVVALRMHLTYDPSVLTLTGVQDGGKLGNGTFTAGKNLSAVPYTVLWEDGLTTEDHTETGTLVTYTFLVNESAQAGTTSVTVTLDPVSTYNAAMQAVRYDVQNGNVTVNTRIAGDANADGTLDMKDVVALRRFLAGGWSITVDIDSADVDGDGVLSLRDCTLISRSLAGGWNITLK
ncbi:MAG: leucine-rich repeat protein [Clostridia bacterium]|nr:leucine-rich repeat protein [Clostridia bacterium]